MSQTNLKDVNIEQGKVEVEIFNQTDAALAHLREKYSEVPSTETDEGYEFVKGAVKELTGYRTKLDAERKRVKQPYLDAGRIIDAEAKRLTAELVTLEDPMKAAKKLADDREKLKKAERIARLQKKVDAIAAWVSRAKGQSSDTIAEMTEEVESIAIDDFYDLTADATRVRDETLNTLAEMFTEQLNKEQRQRELEAAQAEQEKARAAQREAEAKAEIESRLNKLRMIPIDLMGKPSADIRKKLAQLTNYKVPASEFGDRAQESATAQKQVITQLEMMVTQAEAMEQVQAEQKEISDRAAADEAAKVEADKAREAELTPESEPNHDEKEQEVTLSPAWIDVADWCDRYEIENEAAQELEAIINAHFTLT